MNAIRIFLMFAAIALTGCASVHPKNPADPLEAFNRGVYQFNDSVDKAVAKPVAQGYDALMPETGKILVSNFFSNLDDVMVVINDLLQFKLVQAFSDSGRLLINTTVGVFGLVDVATPTGFGKHNEDFGQTLGYWGVDNGPYLMLPLFGPSTVRDSVGLYVDSRPSRLRHIDHMRTRNQLVLTKAVNTRAHLLDQEKVLDEAAIDRYAFLRDTYLMHRKSQVYDGNPPREKYEEDDSENRQAPAAKAPSALQDSAPALPLDSAPAALLAANAVQLTAPKSYTARPNIHKLWIAQRTGIR